MISRRYTSNIRQAEPDTCNDYKGAKNPFFFSFFWQWAKTSIMITETDLFLKKKTQRGYVISERSVGSS